MNIMGNGGNSEFFLNIARGNVNGYREIDAIGKYTATGAVTNIPITPSGTFKVPSASGIQMRVVSTSTNDTNTTGSGARTLHIDYLDANLIPREEVIALNGITPVSTIATNIRFVQSMHILIVGVGISAAGDITIQNIAGTEIYNTITATSRRSTNCARMVPAGKKLFLTGATGGSASSTAATVATIKVSTTYFDGTDFTPLSMVFPIRTVILQDNSIELRFDIAKQYPSGTVILMEVTTDKAASIVGDWFGWLEDE